MIEIFSSDSCSIEGWVTIEQRRKVDNKLISTWRGQNLMTDAGKDILRDVLLGAGFPPVSIAVGTEA